MTRRSALGAGTSDRVLSRSRPQPQFSLAPLETGTYLALPQVARLACIALDPQPAVLLTTPERLRLYRDLPAFGASISLNPGVADWQQRAQLVVLDIETALADFPDDPARYRLELRLGESYPREPLLDRLYDLGYEREDTLDPAQLERASGFFSVRGDMLKIHVRRDASRQEASPVQLRAEFLGDELEALYVGEDRLEEYSLGPVGEAVLASIWTSTRLEQLQGRLYLDAPEFFDGHLLGSQVARLRHELAKRDVVAFGRYESLGLESRTLDLEALPFYRARLRAFAEDARRWLAEGYRVIVLLKHERSGRYLEEKLLGDVSRAWAWQVEGELGVLTFVQAYAEGGFIDRANRTVVVTEELLYGFQGGAALRSQRLKGPPVGDATSLSVGDYLIHPEHGIGQFQSLESKAVLGVVRDYLVLRYANDARILLPVEQLPALRRHPGTTDDPPRLSSLGTNEWTRAREKARANAEELAKTLLVQYAVRQATPGYAFAPLEDWDRLIAENFPHTLTPDQDKAVCDAMRDLEKPVPMDRLISGDVGFGKTEVAVRTAHRVVGHGKQVAVLVPTTLLADQHLETFINRFRELPVRVAGLSRFTSAKEAALVYEGLKRGTVDIVIGTHRLLSEELRFKDLGLLIIDEEHRFGVMQKEKLKALRSAKPLLPTPEQESGDVKPAARVRGRKKIEPLLEPAVVESPIVESLEALTSQVIGEKAEMKLSLPEFAVDVLSMSATPIPRTLYMSMVGIRDMSHIATPPLGRKPIRTTLTPFEPGLVRDAVMLEVERGGKAFFIHDRVQSIGSRARYLQNLIPEARIAVAHGQMRDDDIEEVMLGFEEGAYDLLVATTIVESGLDIPEANTILIERADRLGLAQLYQLRGRVGRRAQEAYAYLFYPPRLTENAERRLWAIADLADLGSGHLLAEKDMEIRGIGNILGPEQHGHIQLVSLEVYTELLAEAIARLKGESKEVFATRLAIDLAVDARLSEIYIPDDAVRIAFYGRLSESTSLVEISRAEREMKARYGALPREVQNFLDIARLRVVAAAKGVLGISEAMTHIQVTFGHSLDYDARAFKNRRFVVEETRYPPGFRVEKRGLKPDEYARELLELLYHFA